MKLSVLAISCGLAILVNQATVSIADADSQSVFLESGKRFLVKAKGRRDYKPKVVDCSSSKIKICLRDTRGTPANNPIENVKDGNLRVTFTGWGITYIISPDGTGTTLDKAGKVLGPFTWKLIP